MGQFVGVTLKRNEDLDNTYEGIPGRIWRPDEGLREVRVPARQVARARAVLAEWPGFFGVAATPA